MNDDVQDSDFQYADAPPWYVRLTTWSCAVILPLFGLFRGGNSLASVEAVQAIVYLLLIGVGVSLYRGAKTQQLLPEFSPVFRRIAWCGGIFLGLLLLQVLPLPLFLLDFLSEQSAALYRHVPSSFGSLSIDVSKTFSQSLWFLSLFALLLWFLNLPGGVARSVSFYQKSTRSKNRVRVVVLEMDFVLQLLSRVLIWTSVLFAALALLHQLFGVESLFGIYPVAGTGQRTHVPFANPNHLAVFLEMAFFLSLCVLMFSLEESASSGEPEPKGSRKEVILNFLSIWLYGFVAAFLLIALVATVSRVGIALVLFGILMLAVFLYREGRFPLLSFKAKNSSVRKSGASVEERLLTMLKLGIALVFLVALLVAFLGESGRETVTERFGEGIAQGIDSFRREFFSISISAIPTYFFFGAGLGCWHFAVSPFASESLAGIQLDYAHNDFLQLFVETGVIGAVIALTAIIIVVRYFVAAWRESGLYVERVGLLTGFLAVALPLLHSLLDFPFHIPMLALSFVLVLAMLLRRVEGRV